MRRRFVWITPNQCNDMHGGVYVTVAGHRRRPRARTAAEGRPERRRAQAEGGRVRAGGRPHDLLAQGPGRRSAIVVVTDENDFTGNAETDGWETAEGCCDSPVRSAGDPAVSTTWPGGTYGGGLIRP